MSDIARRPANFSLNGPRLATPTGLVGGKQEPAWLYVTKLTPVPVQFPNTRPHFADRGQRLEPPINTRPSVAWVAASSIATAIIVALAAWYFYGSRAMPGSGPASVLVSGPVTGG
ncbi:hypothetical protein, partial [Mesorhizobium sp.]|uniref:hypothetical protein n=1 Tax=Mesorhizobium sp. TaxID=1871066 RepID=UPI0025F06024